MSYTPNTTWVDGSGGGTPLSAARLNNMELGVVFPAAARVYHNANQSIANATDTILAFNSERFDTDVIHDTVTNNSRLTCKTAGKYQITAGIGWAANATGYRIVHILHNGSVKIASETAPVVSATVNQFQNVTTFYDLAVNDYVEVQVEQTSTAALNVLVLANRSAEFMMVKVA